jgi:hypothetical protein
MRTLKFSISLLFIFLISCSKSDDNKNSEPTCTELTAKTLTAKQAFENASVNNKTELCNAYKVALQNQISACGDTTGVLQAIINDLGDCTLPPTPTGTLSMNLGSAPLTFDVITVTTIGTTRKVHGEKSNSASYEIDFEVQVGQTGANKINNFKLRLFSQTFTPLIPAVFGNNWTNNITVNSGTSVVGTFRGELDNASQTSAQDLLNGVVNINF